MMILSTTRVSDRIAVLSGVLQEAVVEVILVSLTDLAVDRSATRLGYNEFDTVVQVLFVDRCVIAIGTCAVECLFDSAPVIAPDVRQLGRTNGDYRIH